ncbi:uncharacterized protein LOC132902242 [Amyelois transitella]|uniref:uncharacterized protein LOC132902242 n=1 Tax=Amyelois transitella TaxID=680683 RepID=UPI00298F7423|nr:uncharacterized protein LOC132902242 [Amyelois transitella]
MTESVNNSSDISGVDFMTETTLTPSMDLNQEEFTSTMLPAEQILITESVRNTTDVKSFHNEVPDTLSVFEAFIMIEIIMTAIELCIWTVAALKIQRWRKNYRNQMLMQLSVVRFLKRLIFLLVYLRDCSVITTSVPVNTILISSQFYIDFVIVFLVLFFVKHMYDSLIVVIVRISQNNLIKKLAVAWLLPLPITMACTSIISFNVLNEWTVSLLICSLIRWPLILISTILYLTILFRVLKEKIRKFARSLAVITFLLCLVINLYLFSKDVINLWCLNSFPAVLTSYLLGFFLNFLILCLYITLITLNLKSNATYSEEFAKNNLDGH